MISDALFEELIEDTRRLTALIIEWGDRWSRYGDQLGDRASESQRQEIETVLREFVEACERLSN